MNAAAGHARSPAMLAIGIRALALSVGLFGLLRLGWVEANLLWPFTMLQARLAAWGGGGPETLARVGLNCSGADAIALCLAFILAWPVRWGPRLVAAAGGVLFIVGLNIVRILTLVRLDPSPWFTLLHEYVWPAALTLASAGYVFGWMWHAETRTGRDPRARPAAESTRSGPFTRFAIATVVCVGVFFATMPWYLESAPVLALAGWMAAAAASIMGWFGASATASGAVLMTARGGFLVTGECIATPVIPVGIAAALTLTPTWTSRTLALVVAGPLFVVLGIARLLVLALPAAAVDAPELWAHAFFQTILAMLAVLAVVIRGHGNRTGGWRHLGGRTVLASTIGVIVAVVLGLQYAEVVQAAGLSLAAPLVGAVQTTAAADPQRALALLPPFQVGLFVALTIALTVAWNTKRWVGALAVLGLSQVLLFALIHAIGAVGGPPLPVPGVRAWALGAPVLLLLVANRRFTDRESGNYLGFWERVGRDFPDLGGAASTDFYFENERRLLSEHLPRLSGAMLLKTDLWDEARNTRILQWAAEQGARPYGVDISRPTIAMARGGFGARRLHAAAADVRSLPFGSGQFDAVYSMGTIEHFDDSETAVGEMFRVLKPGGRAIVGVPNRWDPFLRPLQVRVMQYLGIYGYGEERSFSRGSLRRMLERNGFEVVAETAILFIPGWLRMLDLACHTWCRPLTRITALMVAPFVYLDRYVPAVRSHGYLLATVAIRPVDDHRSDS